MGIVWLVVARRFTVDGSQIWDFTVNFRPVWKSVLVTDVLDLV